MRENANGHLFLANGHEDRRPIAFDDGAAQARLELGKLAASRLTPASVDLLRKVIAFEISRSGAHPVYLEWIRLADAGAAYLARALADDTVRGQYLRSMVPLRVFITQEERCEALSIVARRLNGISVAVSA